MSPRLEFALDAALKAGQLTLEYFQTGAKVELKPDGSPVTIADKETEKLIRAMIAVRFPGEAILGEEEGGSLSEEDRTGWVVDPIDGTKSFICGVPLYATLISYEEKGEPMVAVSHFPALNETVYAERGFGTFWREHRCYVSTVDALEKSFLSSGSQFSMASACRSECFGKLVQTARATRTWTDAYGHALVATGRIEAMIDPIVAPWDISAMRLIVREAGGKFTDFQGGEYPQNEAIASNGLIHEKLLEAFAQ